MKNSRGSQIVVLIGLAISLILCLLLLIQRHYRNFDYISRMLYGSGMGQLLEYGLFAIAVCAIIYYVVFSEKKTISIAISIVAIVVDILVTFIAFSLSYYAKRYDWNFWKIIRWISNHVRFGGIFFALLLIFIALLVAFLKSNALAKSQKQREQKSTYTKTDTTISNESYCGMAKHVLLLLFTFGIWYYMWIYRMTGYTNAAENEEYRNPTKKLLLCLFVPFYIIYWTYKTAQRVDKMAVAKEISSDMATLCLILAIFVPIIPPILLQDKMNNIATANDTQYVSTPKGEKVNGATLGTAEELKNFKELLDSGVITQEEFDAKKKQLLGL